MTLASLKSTCSISECERRSHTRGWCKAHYERWRRHGNPLTILKLTREPSLEKKFFAHLDKEIESGGCWIWKGGTHARGYARIGHNMQRYYAHRVSYELHFGPIPNNLTIDHLCRNKACVNPAHLEAVSIRTNLLRGRGFSGMNARKTHCKYGHPLTEGNIYRQPSKPAHHRACLTCNRTRNKKGAAGSEEHSNHP